MIYKSNKKFKKKLHENYHSKPHFYLPFRILESVNYILINYLQKK